VRWKFATLGVIGSINSPAANMVRHHGVAATVVGVLADPARAQDLAIADFQNLSFKLIVHIRHS